MAAPMTHAAARRAASLFAGYGGTGIGVGRSCLRVLPFENPTGSSPSGSMRRRAEAAGSQDEPFPKPRKYGEPRRDPGVGEQIH
jgi:hypothetical protein